MPQIMIEAFAKSLINKIMEEAFNIMDDDNGKLIITNEDELTNIETQSTTNMHDHSCTGLIEHETVERIEMMVRGLRNLRIGDSPSVPSLLTDLEKQVKHVAHNIDCSISTTERTKTAEIPIIQGQGDVNQITHNAIIETPSEPTCTPNVGENCESNDVARISGTVLHRMIEELETQEEAGVAEEIESESINTEAVASANEVNEGNQSTTDLPSTSNFKNNDTSDFVHEELASLSLAHSTPFTNTYLEDVAIEEIALSSLSAHAVSSPDIACEKNKRISSTKPEKLRKKGIFSRMRKILRTIFGRRKN
nr:uncharacterized protein LOC116429432 [Nomia melanderi]